MPFARAEMGKAQVGLHEGLDADRVERGPEFGECAAHQPQMDAAHDRLPLASEWDERAAAKPDRLACSEWLGSEAAGIEQDEETFDRAGGCRRRVRRRYVRRGRIHVGRIHVGRIHCGRARRGRFAHRGPIPPRAVVSMCLDRRPPPAFASGDGMGDRARHAGELLSEDSRQLAVRASLAGFAQRSVPDGWPASTARWSQGPCDVTGADEQIKLLADAVGVEAQLGSQLGDRLCTMRFAQDGQEARTGQAGEPSRRPVRAQCLGRRGTNRKPV